MPTFYIILIEPKNEGNVGAVSRSMKNLGFKHMRKVRGVDIGDVAEKRSMHALEILKKCRTFDTFEDSVKDMDMVIGTSAVRAQNDKTVMRVYTKPWDFAGSVLNAKGKVAICFGREDHGMSLEELRRCDVLLSIPTTSAYRSFNLSHAVAIVMYEIYSHKIRLGEQITEGTTEPVRISGKESAHLHAEFDRLLDAEEYPDFKKENTKIMFRRMMGRAVPSEWEFFTLMGVMKRARRKIEQGKSQPAENSVKKKAPAKKVQKKSTTKTAVAPQLKQKSKKMSTMKTSGTKKS